MSHSNKDYDRDLKEDQDADPERPSKNIGLIGKNIKNGFVKEKLKNDGDLIGNAKRALKDQEKRI